MFFFFKFLCLCHFALKNVIMNERGGDSICSGLLTLFCTHFSLCRCGWWLVRKKIENKMYRVALNWNENGKKNYSGFVFFLFVLGSSRSKFKMSYIFCFNRFARKWRFLFFFLKKKVVMEAILKGVRSERENSIKSL